MNRLLAALERIATALEQLVPALQQATREARRVRPGDNPELDAAIERQAERMRDVGTFG